MDDEPDLNYNWNWGFVRRDVSVSTHSFRMPNRSLPKEEKLVAPAASARPAPVVEGKHGWMSRLGNLGSLFKGKVQHQRRCRCMS